MKLRTWTLFLLAVIISHFNLYSTDYLHIYSYTYDECGNRITRTYHHIPPRLANPNLNDTLLQDSLNILHSLPYIKSTQSGDIDIKVFPNPTSGIINIDFPNFVQSIKIEPVSISGNKFESIKLQGQYIQLDFSQFESGTYVLNITLNDNYMIAKKIIIIK